MLCLADSDSLFGNTAKVAMSDSWPRPGRSFKPSQNAQIGARSAAKCPLEAVTRLIWGHSGPWPGATQGQIASFAVLPYLC